MTQDSVRTTLLLSGGEIVSWQEGAWRLTRADVWIEGGEVAAIDASPDLDSRPAYAGEVIDCRGMILMPGLSNCHAHVLEMWQRSFHDALPFEPWIAYKAALDSRNLLTPQELASMTRLVSLELLRNGVTSVVDHIYQRPQITEESMDAIIGAYVDSGMRAWVAPALLDLSRAEANAIDLAELDPALRPVFTRRPPFSVDEQLAVAEYAIKQAARTTRVRGIVGPGGPTFCTRELFEKAVELSERYDTLLHTHILETRSQRLQSMKQLGMGTVDYLQATGALNGRLFTAHSIWLDREEIEMFAEAGASIVHNPYSNMRLGSGYCPLPEYRKAGVNVALGSDGGDSGDSYSILDQARLASMLHRAQRVDSGEWLRGEDAFSMAVQGGARILTGGKGGNIEVGKLADVVIVRKDHRFLSPDHAARSLVHSGSITAMHVIVGGDVVLRDGRSPSIDEAADLAVVQEATARGIAMRGEADAEVSLLYPVLQSHYERSASRIGSFVPGSMREEA